MKSSFVLGGLARSDLVGSPPTSPRREAFDDNIDTGSWVCIFHTGINAAKAPSKPDYRKPKFRPR